MSRPRKNVKRIDPRYFMDEKMEVLSENVEVTEQGCKRARNILDSEQFGDSASANDFEETYGMAPHPYYQKCPNNLNEDVTSELTTYGYDDEKYPTELGVQKVSVMADGRPKNIYARIYSTADALKRLTAGEDIAITLALEGAAIETKLGTVFPAPASQLTKLGYDPKNPKSASAAIQKFVAQVAGYDEGADKVTVGGGHRSW